MRKVVFAVLVLVCLTSCTVRTTGTATGTSTPEPSDRAAGKVNTLEDVAVGDCIEFVDRPPAEVEVATIECAQPAAVYEVAATLPSPTAECATDRYDRYYQTGHDEFTLCLMLNATEGECFDGLLVGAGPSGPVRADCATAGARVTRVLPGTADENACPAGTALPMAYPEPAPGRTVCVTVP